MLLVVILLIGLLGPEWRVGRSAVSREFGGEAGAG
jgi:hypothetical protein